MLYAVQNIVGTSTLCKLAVAVKTHYLYGPVHVSFVRYKAFAQVISLTGSLKYFGFEET